MYFFKLLGQKNEGVNKYFNDLININLIWYVRYDLFQIVNAFSKFITFSCVLLGSFNKIMIRNKMWIKENQ